MLTLASSALGPVTFGLVATAFGGRGDLALRDAFLVMLIPLAAGALSSWPPAGLTRPTRPERACWADDEDDQVNRTATTVYTDGACLGNPGPGGWAWAVPDGPFASGAEPRTTNQRMEIQAALAAVTELDGPLDVFSDSTYVVNAFRDRWWEGWVARGWLNAQKKPVANRDLWEPLINAYRADPGRIRFFWVKGHANDPFNDLVDRLAVEAASTQQPRRGTGTPEVQSRPDRRSRSRRSHSTPSGPEAPAGHLLTVTGLKPPDLGGYSDNPVAASVQSKLSEILLAKAAMHPDLAVLTGLGLGAEQLAAAAAAAEGIPYVAVLPFPGSDVPWSAASRRRFADLLAAAKDTITMQSTVPASRQGVAGAFARRDAWLGRHADEALVVFDGSDGAVGRALRSLQDQLGEEQVWVLEP